MIKNPSPNSVFLCPEYPLTVRTLGEETPGVRAENAAGREHNTSGSGIVIGQPASTLTPFTFSPKTWPVTAAEWQTVLVDTGSRLLAIGNCWSHLATG